MERQSYKEFVRTDWWVSPAQRFWGNREEWMRGRHLSTSSSKSVQTLRSLLNISGVPATFRTWTEQPSETNDHFLLARYCCIIVRRRCWNRVLRRNYHWQLPPAHVWHKAYNDRLLLRSRDLSSHKWHDPTHKAEEAESGQSKRPFCPLAYTRVSMQNPLPHRVKEYPRYRTGHATAQTEKANTSARQIVRESLYHVSPRYETECKN